MDNVNVSDPERCSFKGGVCPISGPAPLQPRLLHFILQNSFQISFNQCPNIENHNTETMVAPIVVRCSAHCGSAVRVRRSYADLQSVTKAAGVS